MTTATATATATATPVHQLPTSCHVCGEPAAAATSRPACRHDWTNAEAFADAGAHDRRVRVAYSSGATTAEAAYVAQHRPA